MLQWSFKPKKSQYEAPIRIGPFIKTTARVTQHITGGDWHPAINGISVDRPNAPVTAGYPTAEEAKAAVEAALAAACREYTA